MYEEGKMSNLRELGYTWGRNYEQYFSLLRIINTQCRKKKEKEEKEKKKRNRERE